MAKQTSLHPLHKAYYGWIYDKQGNKRIVHAPTTGDGKPVKPHTKTVTGKIPDNIGYPGFPDNKK